MKIFPYIQYRWWRFKTNNPEIFHSRPRTPCFESICRHCGRVVLRRFWSPTTPCLDCRSPTTLNRVFMV